MKLQGFRTERESASIDVVQAFRTELPREVAAEIISIKNLSWQVFTLNKLRGRGGEPPAQTHAKRGIINVGKVMSVAYEIDRSNHGKRCEDQYATACGYGAHSRNEDPGANPA